MSSIWDQLPIERFTTTSHGVFMYSMVLGIELGSSMKRIYLQNSAACQNHIEPMYLKHCNEFSIG